MKLGVGAEKVLNVTSFSLKNQVVEPLVYSVIYITTADTLLLAYVRKYVLESYILD